MPEQPGEPSFAHRLRRLEQVVTRAVQVATTLKLASSPTQVPSRRAAKNGHSVVLRRADIEAPIATPPEVTTWLDGLAAFHRQLAASDMPNRDALVRQLERQVDSVADEIGGVAAESTEAVTQFMGMRGKASL